MTVIRRGATGGTRATTPPFNSLRSYSAALGIGWLALLVLLFSPLLWEEPSFLPEALPGIYNLVSAVVPAGADATPNVAGHLLTSTLYLLVLGVIWWAFLGALRLAEDRDRDTVSPEDAPSRGRILLTTLFFALPALLWMGLFSADLYVYAMQGQMQILHGYNPLVDPPNVLGNDPLLALTPWNNIPTTYGPIWIGLTTIVAALAEAVGGQSVLYLLLYRLVELVLLLVAGALIWAIGGELGWGTRRRGAATMLLCWCPIMVMELVGNGHNDGLLVVFVLLAIWLHLRGLWPLAVAALVAAGLVKLSGYFLLPAYGVLLLRSSRDLTQAARRVAGGALVVALTAGFAYIPYAHPALLKSLTSNPFAGFTTNSLAGLARALIIEGSLLLSGIVTPADLTWRQALEAVRLPIWYGPILLWLILAAVISLTARDFKSLLRAWWLLLFSYLLIGSPWFQPWYITWLLPMVAFLPAGRIRNATWLLAAGGMAAWAVLPLMNSLLGGDSRGAEFYMPVVIFFPVLIYCAAMLWQMRGAITLTTNPCPRGAGGKYGAGIKRDRASKRKAG